MTDMRVTCYRQFPGSKATGFTLIELLVASSIFAMVALLGYATVANTHTIEGYSALQRRLGEAAVFSLEAIAREVRLANGSVDSNLGPFVILDATGQQVTLTGPDNRVTGSQLLINMTKPHSSVVTARIIRLLEDPNGQKAIVMETCADSGCIIRGKPEYLTPIGVAVTDLTFRMLPANNGTRQPFLEISLTLSASDNRQTLTQTLQTLVSSRYYRYYRLAAPNQGGAQ